jgi:hypothetical protein
VQQTLRLFSTPVTRLSNPLLRMPIRTYPKLFSHSSTAITLLSALSSNQAAARKRNVDTLAGWTMNSPIAMQCQTHIILNIRLRRQSAPPAAATALKPSTASRLLIRFFLPLPLLEAVFRRLLRRDIRDSVEAISWSRWLNFPLCRR